MRVEIASPLFILITCALSAVNSYKVLLVFPMTSRSHDILARGVIREMLKRGHEVTYISAFPRNEPTRNLREVDVSYILNRPSTDANDAGTMLTGSRYSGSFANGVATLKSLVARLLEHDVMRQFIADPTNQFDVVVVEWFNNEVLAGFSTIFQCPLVWYSSLDMHGTIARLMGDIMNPSYSTHILSSDVPPFDFLQRIQSLWTLFEDLYYTAQHLSGDIDLYTRVFAEAAENRGIELPQYEDLIYNASLLLVNSHPSISLPVSLPQNAKSVGGHHIEVPTRPLPPYIKKIMDESEHGVIYFSHGSMMKSSAIPEEMKSALMKLFGGLNETVLWKYEEQIPNVPKNVHVVSWMPQPAILEHPNTKLFITHGGLLSTTEAIHYGAPIVGIPIFGDQFLSMARSEMKGYATTVQFTKDLSEDLKNAIELVLRNPKYAETAKELSELYHLRPQPAGEELAYWLEYVIRTKGAPHLRSPALMLPWYQRFYVDLMAVVLVIVIVLILILRCMLKTLISVCSKKQKDE